MHGYLVALDGVSIEALKQTALAIIQGEIEDLSVKVCPTPPELSRAVRKRMAEDRGRALSGSTAFTPRPFISIKMHRDAVKRRMEDEGRVKLLEVDSHMAAIAAAKHGEVPPGAVYSAVLGAFYSAPGYVAAQEIDRPEFPVDDSGEFDLLASDQL